jgi:hypothetical protein
VLFAHRSHSTHGKMHSTSRGPSFSKRCGGLPCMPGPLWFLQRVQLRIVLAAVTILLPIGERHGQPERRWRVR